MAKKVRRSRSQSPRTYAQAGKSSTTTAGAPTAQTKPPASRPTAGTKASAAPAKTVDLKAEYTYVSKDLRRLFITAAVLLLVLVALNFIVQ